MWFGVLGPLEVAGHTGTPIEPGWPKQRLVLATLLCHPNRAVSVERLADVAWGGRPPRSVRANLQTYVHRLRRALGDPDRITHGAAGYTLRVEAGELDAELFERMTAEGTADREAGDLDRAAEVLVRALALWRGGAYAGFADVEVLREERLRLEELRLAALESRLEVDLALGRHAEVVPELIGMVDEYPLRERFRAQLMLGLYRCGRQAEALATYRAGRELLLEELGLDPGEELRQLETAILADDRALDLQAPSKGSALKTPAELPPDLDTFTGRAADVAAVTGLITRERAATAICAIAGPAGVGKSAVAVRAGHQVAAAFPDGQLYAQLHGATPGIAPVQPDAVLRRFHRSLGIPDAEVPPSTAEAAASFRSLTAGRRMLIVLDDAADAEQVRPLLPGGSGNAVLVTSRRPLAALDGADHVREDGMNEPDAIALLDRLAGAGRAAAEPDAVVEIVRLCGHLPLAIRIAGARLAARHEWRLAHLAERLTDARYRLDELSYADLAVRASFDASYHDLGVAEHGEADARLFQLVGILETPDISPPVAAALADQEVAETEASLDRLLDAQLLQSTRPGRYSMHDLVRLYAREAATLRLSETERTTAVRRALHCLLATARQASVMLVPQSVRRFEGSEPPDHPGVTLSTIADAADWTDSEALNLVAAAHQAAAMRAEGSSLVGELARALRAPMAYRGALAGLLDLEQLSLSTAESTGDALATAAAHSGLAVLYRYLGRNQDAVHHGRRAVEGYRTISRPYGLAAALDNLGNAYSKLRLFEEAEPCYREAIDLVHKLGDLRGEETTLNNLGLVQHDRGDFDGAIATFERCLAILHDSGDAEGAGVTLGNLAEARRRSGRPGKAVEEFERAIALLHESGERRMEPEAWWNLGCAYDDLGERERARECWRTALDLLQQMDLTSPHEANALLETARPEPPKAIQDMA